MSQKQIELPEIGKVIITKKRGMRSIRLRIGHNNEVLASSPKLVSYSQIISFIENKKDWILEHQVNQPINLYHGMGLGQSGTLRVVQAQSTKISDDASGVIIKLAPMQTADEHRDKIINKAIKYLSNETEVLIFPRLLELSSQTQTDFNQVSTRKLRSRWASCDSNKDITINLFLVQLDQELIDYVLYHELAHTIHMNHSRQFWDTVAQWCPEYKILRKRLKSFEPRLIDSSIVVA